ncbi:MAG: TonB-dependent receptor, partial [Planctomycetes bacterium]|nr:TonB-dependent receptor [Planctomycetota bacterium]
MAILVLVVAAPATAQISVGGSVRGTVSDAQGGVLPGVTVTATSPSAVRPSMVVTDARGYYRLTDLQPGSYVLTAELSGFAKYERRGVELRVALNIAVDIVLQVGALTETVQVMAETPMLEVEKPVQAVNISGDFQRALPLLPKRDWSSYLEVTPSITSLDNGGGYSQVYMVRGGEMEGHVFQLDGTDIGGFRQARADAIQLSTEAIQDVQVKTGALDASAPLGVGVVVNMATKTGTNVFHGAASIVYQAKAWNGNNAVAGGTPASAALVQPDLSLGGPIVKDRAFFFGAYQYSRQTSGLSRTADNITTLRGVKPDFEPFDNENRFNFFFVKGTLQFSSNHQLMAYVENDIAPKDINYNIDGSRFERDSYGGKAFGARFSSVWGSKVTTKFAAAWNDKSYSRDTDIFIKNEGPSIQIYNATALSGGNRTGQAMVAQLNNMTSWTTSPASKYTINGDLTWYKSGWGGTHEFQTGFFLQPNSRNENNSNFPNGGQNFVAGVLNDPKNPAAGYTIFQKRQYAVDSLTTKSVKAQDYGFYVQDLWKPVPRLSISLGLRADKVIVDDLIFDKNIQHAWEIGPRLGATYMLTADGHNVLRASWTKVADMPQGTLIQALGSTAETQTDYYDNNLDGVFESSVTVPASTKLNQSRQIDPNLHMGYFKEMTVGFARQFKGQVSVDATFIRRDYMDRPALVDVNGIYDGV